VIAVRDLTVRFGDFQAVSRISFDVEEGEIFGFIGPNGAGKTTTIRILATLLLPTSGTASILGHDVTEEPEAVRQVTGYMPDVWGVYPGLTVAEYLDFFAAAYGIPRRERARAVGDVMALTDLTPLARKLVETLSKGMKQRLCLAKTLIHDPRLLILDEPANGLDPRARIELRALLRELASMGKTVLISSHILTELSDLVSSVGIVERGRMLMSGEVGGIIERLRARAEGDGDGPAAADALIGAAGGPGDGPAGAEGEAAAPPRALRRFTLRTTAERVDAARDLLLARPDVKTARVVDEREVAFAYPGAEEAVADIVRALVGGDVPVLGLHGEKADLESLFMAVTRGDVQ